ncbi:MAG: 2-dehydropantoate 2-reductase [Chloroflexi bacterium]|nr:2-dehydropantoate 2-reductase [Chloroflexota bacterium]
MRIAIMGVGGVGGYFGGLLAQAGEDVTFIARGEHLRAMQAHGLRVESIHGDFTIAPVQATDDPAVVGPVDTVIFATKTYQLDAAAQAMQPLIGPGTTVLPLHNGVDAAERTAAIVGREHVLGGLCYVGSQILAPGVIKQVSQFRRVVAGELGGPATPRVGRIVAALQHAGAVAEATDDIQKMLWTKFAFIAPFSGVGAVTRVPAGEIVACPEARALAAAAVAEVEAVARAQGVALDADITPKTLAFIDNLTSLQVASMQRDVLEGRPSELESMIGAVVRFGAELGVPTPVFEFFYAALLPQERRARKT